MDNKVMDVSGNEEVKEELRAYERMNEVDKEKVDGIIGDVDILDSTAVLQFGVQAQSNISSFSNKILSQVRPKDSGYVGQVLSELMVNVREMEIDDLNGNKGFLGIFGGLKKKSQKFMSRYEKLSSQIDKVITNLDKSKMQLLKDISMVDELYDKNLEYHKELEYYIVAGELKVQEIKDKLIPEMKAKAKASGDPIDAQKANDYAQLLNRFEKKVHDLKLSRMISLQTGPQLRLIQSSDQVLVEKIQSSILNTIPLWKNQIVIAVSLMRQEKALNQQKEVTKTTNDLLSKNSELLKDNTVEVAKESERGIVEIETLKKVNQDLLDTIDETLQIQKEGSMKRAEAEKELKQMEQDFKDKLTQRE